MTWTVDPAHSAVEFTAKHMMFTTVRGHFNKFEITLNLNEDHIEQSSVEATVDLASISTRDEKRDAHLRSADFFDAETHPQMTFRSTKITPTSKDQFDITGILTIKGVSNEVVFHGRSEGQGKSPWGSEVRSYSAETTLNRKDWGLNWNVALETGGVLVSDQIKVTLDIEAVKSAPVAATATA